MCEHASHSNEFAKHVWNEVKENTCYYATLRVPFLLKDVSLSRM